MKIRISTYKKIEPNLKNTLCLLIPEKQKKLKNIKDNFGEKHIHNVTVNEAIGGMRGIKSLLWDTSLLDPEKGITFHNKTINELRKDLPKSNINNLIRDGPMSVGMLWFLMTGKIPTQDETNSLRKELYNRSFISDEIKNSIINLPKNMHPMTKLSSAVLMFQPNSEFVKCYNNGIPKKDYWEPVYEDVLNLISKLPVICSLIYKSSYNKLDNNIHFDENLDYAANFSNLLGFSNNEFYDLMRLYILIHSDHEGGNASAHTCRLVGSTLSDPYLSFSASMNALAGPLHGLANQEVLKWIEELNDNFKNKNKEVNKKNIEEFAWETLNNGKVIPGYGHAVLRKTDPRYTCQREFALKHLPDDELFKLVNELYQVLPDILKEHGKTKNPYPNVDAHSGVLLKYYNLNEYEYYTVLFGLSRAFGVLSQLFWDRALGLPLERPKSFTLDCIK